MDVLGVFITYDMMDSTVVTYSYLRECTEQIDSLEKSTEKLSREINKGIDIEAELNDLLAIRDSLDINKDNFITYQARKNKTLDRQKKMWKIVAAAEAVGIVTLSILTALP